MATTPNNTKPASARSNPAEAAESTDLQPPKKSDGQPTEDAVRARAYSLWQQAGSPGGDGVEFWHRAQQELTNPQQSG